ncbi:hypothetical protein Glove_137g84 [Diversispora epigaea]|uniref:Uncharacterized protein n=1 Tax=Diversispora epigaea TaxID=1348612 RepID=A0A397J2M8_9GLOM|nr:hypothetical protein Glove_137g84 [Diversispora epigaea]
MEDLDNGLFFDMAPKLDIVKYEIKITEYQKKPVKLKILINQAVVEGFKAQPATEINPAIMNLILWHAKNIISDGNEGLNKYF